MLSTWLILLILNFQQLNTKMSNSNRLTPNYLKSKSITRLSKSTLLTLVISNLVKQSSSWTKVIDWQIKIKWFMKPLEKILKRIPSWFLKFMVSDRFLLISWSREGLSFPTPILLVINIVRLLFLSPNQSSNQWRMSN